VSLPAPATPGRAGPVVRGSFSVTPARAGRQVGLDGVGLSPWRLACLPLMSDDSEPAFVRRADVLVPSVHARSLWGDVINGRNLSGLVAAAAEQDHADADYVPARLTVDMFRAAPLIPVRVTTRIARRGHRVRVVDVSVRDEAGLELTRGSVVLLRKGEAPPGTVWAPAEWNRPIPESLPAVQAGPDGWPPWDMRRAGRHAWIREVRPFIAGEETTPFVRAALAADATNGSANSGDQGLGYINADLTVYLVRAPRGEWIGLEVTGHGSHSGVAFGAASIYDLQGRIGHVAMSAVADRRMLGRHRGVGERSATDTS
jgi:Thioesterase-like superfamily